MLTRISELSPSNIALSRHISPTDAAGSMIAFKRTSAPSEERPAAPSAGKIKSELMRPG